MQGRFSAWQYLTFFDVHFQGTASRFVQFTIPQIISSLNCHLIRWEPSLTLSTNLCGSKICAFSSVHQFPTLLSLIDVFDHCLRSCNTIFENSLAVVEKYFTRISEQKYSHKTMLDLFNQFSKEDEIQPKSYVIPRNLLSKWMAGGELNIIIFLFRFIAIMFLYIQLSLH